MKIMHVTESLAAGVGHYLALVANAQAKLGHQVSIVHSIRPDTPLDQLDKIFDPEIKRVVIPMVTQPSPISDLSATFRLRNILQSTCPDVLHLHSSKAGVIGRVAASSLRLQTRVFYSPHGFAFLRQDVSALKQQIFLCFERAASKMLGTIVACSASEAELAKSKVQAAQVTLVENAADLSEIPRRKGHSDSLVRILNAGRISFQKNPKCFQGVAASCVSLPAQFTWMGDGDLANMLSGLDNIKVTGWLPREALMNHLSEADIFLMPSLWEGMPLALIEAQAVGLPAVVYDVEGCRDVVIDGETGFVCKTTDELVEKTQLLINNPQLRCQLGNNAARISRNRFDVNRLNRELLEVYMDTKKLEAP